MTPSDKFTMQQSIFIAQRNVEHFRQRLATTTDEQKRQDAQEMRRGWRGWRQTIDMVMKTVMSQTTQPTVESA